MGQIQGFGKEATGGRGGTVHFVTNTNDSGTGSLRGELGTNDSARIVMVMTNGTIQNGSNLTIRSNKTILGQTALGQGICLRDRRITMIERSNVIIRFLRSRLGDVVGNESTNVFLRDSTDIVFDHCSFSWGTDETLTTFRSRNITFQWCIVSEGLHRSVHSKGPHGYLWFLGGRDMSVTHCLIVHGSQRCPRPDNLTVYTLEQAAEWRGLIDFRNNVIYNWEENSIHGLEGADTGKMNLVSNFLIPGPATQSGVRRRLMRVQNDGVYNTGYGKLFAIGNKIEGESDIDSDNWAGITLSGSSNKSLSRVDTPFPADVYDFTDSADDAYTKVINNVGCSLNRDSVDTRIIGEVADRDYTFEGSNGSTNGIIDSQTDVGGWPDLTTGGGTVQDAFDQLTTWLDNNGFSDRPELTDWTNATQRSNLATYLAQIDSESGFSIAELYANDLVVGTFDDTPPTSFILNVTAQIGGTVSATKDSEPITFPAELEEDDEVILTATPNNENYVFSGWFEGNEEISSDNPYTFTMPDRNVTLEARFTFIGTPTGKKFFAKKKNQPIT